MLRRLLTGVAAVLIAATARAESADDVIARYLAVHGGIQKLKSVNTVWLRGRMMFGHGGEAPFIRYAKRPNRMRTEFTVQGLTGIQAYDGKDSWGLMPFMGQTTPQVAPAEESRRMAEQADIDGVLVDWKDKGHAVELAGREPVEGAEAWKLKVTLKDGEVRNYYVDVESGLIVKMSGKTLARGSEIEFDTVLGDYREVEGRLMPFSIDSGALGSPMRQKAVIDSVAFNVEMSDTLFAVPATAVRAPAKADSARADSAKTAPGGPAPSQAPPAPAKPRQPDAAKPGSGSRG